MLRLADLHTGSSHETTTVVLPSLKTLQEYLDTYLEKAIADTKDSVRKEIEMRCEAAFFMEKEKDLVRKIQQTTQHHTTQRPPTPEETSIGDRLSSIFTRMTGANVPALEKELSLIQEQSEQSSMKHEIAVKSIVEKVNMLQMKKESDLPKVLEGVIDGLRCASKKSSFE